ncbi:MAG: tetratricopeptide repeat protein [Proteobacteria bacterium]|nr:tetratricopeptide repeat protein [Pseudomonadota bacterium]
MNKEILLKLDKGREYYANRDFERAEPLLLEASHTLTEYADIMNMLGVIYHDRGQVALAQEYFEKALRINPRYTEAALNLAVTYNEQGKYAEAKKIHEHASSLKPDNPHNIEPFARGKITNMHASLGQAYAELGMHAKAIEQYYEALNLSPDFIDIRTRFGQLLRDMGRPEEAKEQFRLAIAKNPKYVPARISLGTTHYAMGHKEKALEQWREAVNIDPQNRTANMYLRMIEQMLAMEEAEAQGVRLEVAQSTKPAKPTADPPSDETALPDNLAFSLAQQGEPTDATPGDEAATTGAEDAASDPSDNKN